MATDINPVLAAASRLQGNISEGAAQVATDRTAQQKIADASSDLYDTIGSAASIVQGVKDAGQIAFEAAKAKVGDVMGTNILAQNEVLTGLAQDQANAYTQKRDALGRIQQKRSTTLFDDPLQYIHNLFTINDDIDQYNAADNIETATAARIKELNDQTQSTNITQGQFQVTMTKAAADANATKITSEASLQSNQAKISALGYNIQGVQDALAMNKDSLAATMNVFQAQKAQEQTKIELSRLALAQAEFKFKQDDRADQQATDAALIDRINKGRTIRMGANATLLDPTTKDGKLALQLIKSGSSAGKEFQEDFFAGNSGVIAPTVARVIDTSNTVGVSFTPAQAPVKKLLGNVQQDIMQAAQGGVDIKNPEVRAQMAQTGSATRLDKMLENIKPGDADNVFNIPKIGSIIQAAPDLQSLPVVQKILAPVLATGAELSPNQAFGLIAQAVQDRTITFEQARDFTTVMQKGVAVNLATKELNKFALVPGKQVVTSYKTDLDVNPNSLFTSKVVNMTDPNDFGRALATFAADRKFGTYQGATGVVR